MIIKKIIICIVCICMFLGCKKEKICNNLPEGSYEGYFTNNGSSNTYYIPTLIVKIIDANTISISILPYTNSSVNRDGCNLKGRIGASIGGNTSSLEINGEIKQKKENIKLKAPILILRIVRVTEILIYNGTKLKGHLKLNKKFKKFSVMYKIILETSNKSKIDISEML